MRLEAPVLENVRNGFEIRGCRQGFSLRRYLRIEMAYLLEWKRNRKRLRVLAVAIVLCLVPCGVALTPEGKISIDFESCYVSFSRGTNS